MDLTFILFKFNRFLRLFSNDPKDSYIKSYIKTKFSWIIFTFFNSNHISKHSFSHFFVWFVFLKENLKLSSNWYLLKITKFNHFKTFFGLMIRLPPVKSRISFISSNINLVISQLMLNVFWRLCNHPDSFDVLLARRLIIGDFLMWL